MKEFDIKKKLLDLTLQCLQEVPSVRSLNYSLDESDPKAMPTIVAETDSDRYLLIIEVRGNGQPRFARDAVASLLIKSGRYPENTYPIFAAPYISGSAAEICRQIGAGHIDLGGNCRILFDGVYIDRMGRPNGFVTKRSLRSLYQTRSSRVLRALLFDPVLKWKLADLSRVAGVSIGQVFNVKKGLIDREWAEFDKNGLRVTQPLKLLQDWGIQYTLGKNAIFQFRSSDAPADTESKIFRHFTKKGIRHALTSFSASHQFGTSSEYDHVYAYIDSAGEADLKLEAGLLGLVPASAGRNVTLLQPYDDGVFFGMKEMEGTPVVSPIQSYLDLVACGENGRRTADALVTRVISKEWQLQ